MILALNKLHRLAAAGGVAHTAEGNLIEQFRRSLSFTLTGEQNKVIKEIQQDMQATRAMNRLLQGDVGSGKTIVACNAIVMSAQSGFQAALMAPTEILAEQHFFTLCRLLVPLNIRVGLLVGSMSPAAKEQLWQDIQSATVQVVVGTHALIEEAIRFKALGLVVIDEQHKFGVQQRSLLRQKGLNPDCLFLTATPIPRTLAMTVYGDLDISTIREMPKGRLPISTYWIEPPAVKNAYQFVREEIQKGRQAYIVYPLIKKSAILEFKAAAEMYTRFKEKEFSDLKLGLIHGQMKGQEKEKIMQDFKNKKIDLLISTTVIEVGIDVPNASVMVVEHAERFGLSQLHQLRGRIGRGPYPSYCLLVCDPQTEKAQRRIDAILSTQDGFELAEEDLDIRGPGQIFGAAQHGLPDFLRIGNIVRDMELMELARKEAFELVKQDPYLKQPQHLLLKKALKEKYNFTNLELLSV